MVLYGKKIRAESSTRELWLKALLEVWRYLAKYPVGYLLAFQMRQRLRPVHLPTEVITLYLPVQTETDGAPDETLHLFTPKVLGEEQ